MKYDFILDAMLGKTAKWLRVLGYSVYYNASVDDDYLISLSKSCNAVLITRDRCLFEKALKKRVKAHLIEKSSNVDILKELREVFNISLTINPEKTRCPKCNNPLIKKNPSSLINSLPEKILKSYNIFFVCTNCGSIYWMGKHFKSMTTILSEIRGDKTSKSYQSKKADS